VDLEVSQDLQVLKVLRESWADLVHKVHLVQLETLDLREELVSKGTWVPLGQKVNLLLLQIQENLFLVPLDPQAFQAEMEIQEKQEKRDRKEKVV